MIKLLNKLIKINILTPIGIFEIVKSVFNCGMNLFALLNYANKLAPKETAIAYRNKELIYSELHTQSKKLAIALSEKFGLKQKDKVAIICRNHIAVINSIFGVSALGADLYLLNPEMSSSQIKLLFDKIKFDFCILDKEVEDKLANILNPKKYILSEFAYELSAGNLQRNNPGARLPRLKLTASNVTVLTGGTSGMTKVAKRKASIFDFLNPFFALLTKIELDKFKSVYIAVPIYHGFGLSTLIVSVLLRAKILISNRFDVSEAAEIIRLNKVEVITLVPAILRRLISHNRQSISYLKRIITGGAVIAPNLVNYISENYGDILYNLYGTSEAGFSVMAEPQTLRREPTTVGKPISGVKLNILDKNNKKLSHNNIGMVYLKTSWSMTNSKNNNIPTGDLGYVDKNGCLFLLGRADDMIISGGENVYPIVVENQIIKHPDIEQTAVIGVDDIDFGQRLKAFVVLSADSKLTEEALLKWLKTKVARYELPAKIVFKDSLPITPVGKIDKKKLRQE